MEKLWQDRHIKKFIYITLVLFILLFFLYISFDHLVNPELSLSYFSITIILTFFLLFLIHIFRVRLTFISLDGIRLGNAPDDSYEKFKLHQKSINIYWNEIKSIRIIGRQIKRPTYIDIINILIISTKKGIKYESFIAQPKGFVKTIKAFKKGHLFVKDSKYLEIIKEK